jgi:amino acid transporter
MLTDFVLAMLMLAFGGIAVGLMLYLATRLLDWSRDKPLPGAHNRILNITLVSLMAAGAMLLIVDVELIALVLSPAGSSLIALLEEIDLLATAVIAFLIVFVFITLRRIKKESSRQGSVL